MVNIGNLFGFGSPGLIKVPVGKILTSPKTTVGLTTILGGLLGGFTGALKGFGAGSLAVTTIGVLQTSPKARKGAKFLLDPTRRLKGGQVIGEVIEEPKSLLERIGVIGKEVIAPVAVVGALTAGGLAVAKKIKGRTKVPSIPTISPVGIALPSAPLPTVEPFAPVKQPEEAPSELIPEKVTPMPSIKNIFKPKVNIKISKTKRFINQQVVVKQ